MIWFCLFLLCIAALLLFLELKKPKKKKTSGTQKAVLRGQAYEKLFPILQDEFNLGDLVFIGHPVDYIAFVGRTGILDGEEEAMIEKIVFIEVKSGQSRLTKLQQSIKKAIQDNKIDWRTIHEHRK